MACCSKKKRQRKTWQKTHVFVIEIVKQKLLFEICKCIFKKEKPMLRAYFC